MKILVTGAKGFIGKNLIATLENIRDGKDTTFGITRQLEIYDYDVNTSPELLNQYCADCNFVFHLAGVNRPKNQNEFLEGNFGFTAQLLDTLKRYNNKAPIMISSSTQAALDNPYGHSKKLGEEAIFSYSKEMGIPVYIYRFPNVFGKWCRPNYNSAIATFCNNIANDFPITVNDPNVGMSLVYIDDLVYELLQALQGNPNKEGSYCRVPIEYQRTLGEIVDLIDSFKKTRVEYNVPNMSDSFTKKMYATYLSYLATEHFKYPLKMNNDDRGSFTEIIRTTNRGQFSVNISKPHITKGNHWHHTKNEKFVVVSGQGIIRFRKIDNNDV
ncbi:MAG: NAD-dependent epimerase/dehydratase family protein, partial [Eubacterium sp.]